MRKQSTLMRRHFRERAAVRIPYEPSGEEPFQALTEREEPVGAACAATRYNRQGLMEPAKEKQIRWHHGTAAFVLKYQNDGRPTNGGAFYVFHLRIYDEIHTGRKAERVL